MDTPFIYDKYVTGKNFIGRKEDCIVLSNLLSAGESVAIYEPPKTGKKSLLQQTLFNMRIGGKRFGAALVSLGNIRNAEAFAVKFCSSLIRSVATTPDEYEEIFLACFKDTRISFDRKRYAELDELAKIDGPLAESDIKALLMLPEALSDKLGFPIYIALEEFQNICRLDDNGLTLKLLSEYVLRKKDKSKVSYIFMGSKLNAMKELFEQKKIFGGSVERLPLHKASQREIIDHITKGFSTSGKAVTGSDLLPGMCNLFRNNLWHINHLIYITDSLSKGYINEGTFMDALGSLVSIHEPAFRSLTDELTTFQLRLLKALLDGHKKFSVSEVIDKYGLNSSANVKRLKDALMKKEVIAYTEKDEPYIIDPLYEYWLRKHFFEKNKV